MAVLPRPAAGRRVPPSPIPQSSNLHEAGSPRTPGAYLSSLVRNQTFFVWGILKMKSLRNPQPVKIHLWRNVP